MDLFHFLHLLVWSSNASVLSIKGTDLFYQTDLLVISIFIHSQYLSSSLFTYTAGLLRFTDVKNTLVIKNTNLGLFPASAAAQLVANGPMHSSGIGCAHFVRKSS